MSAEELETPKTFTLISPIAAGETQVSELTLQEPTAGDVEQLIRDEAKDGAMGAMIKLIGKQTKLPLVDVRKMSARDFKALADYLSSFFPSDKTS